MLTGFNRVSMKASGEVNDKGYVTLVYHDRLQCVLDAGFDSENRTTILFQAGLLAPWFIRPGFPHWEFFSATCKRASVDADLHKSLWLIDTEHRTDTPQVADSDDPLDQPVVRTWRTDRNMIVTQYDRNGKVYATTAGEPFEGGIQVPGLFDKLTWVRNEPYFNAQLAKSFCNCLNDSDFMGYEAGTLNLMIQASEKRRGVYHWAEVTYEMEHNPQGWDPQPINAGFFQRLTDSDKLKEIRDEYGQKLRKPWCLDQFGFPLPDNYNPTTDPILINKENANYNPPVFIDQPYFDRIDYNQFNLPTAW